MIFLLYCYVSYLLTLKKIFFCVSFSLKNLNLLNHNPCILPFYSGLTQSNYKELNILYEKNKDQGFEILAFPCNQFAWQEPGTNEEIQEAVCTRFKAEFPIFEKVDVNGNNAAPLYKFLKSEKGGLLVDAIKWNFTKFLVNKEGKVVERYGPRTPPLEIEKDIQDALGLS
ncbi:probable glutathione peroxidase 2 [Olea europaea subsp. europaea]|uniref:Glutathione peroxidase n=1 Tax=Olea europaea subsp. europaea TaxID=158383 RepID=A0A8S0QKP1_OLEEU|nr:probable glutathione peroxidase 2 [Olea europaea subsp. europaea]